LQYTCVATVQQLHVPVIRNTCIGRVGRWTYTLRMRYRTPTDGGAALWHARMW